MSLYFIQNTDRSMYVKADSMGDAVKKWQEIVAIEKEMGFDEVEEPQGIRFLAPDDECVLE